MTLLKLHATLTSMCSATTIVGSPALCVVRSRSCGDEDTLPEQVKASTAVHGALDRLQPIDLTLGGAGAPGRGDGRGHGGLVALDASNETIQRAATSGLYPGLQRCIGAVDIRAALAQEVGEGVGHV